MLETILYLIFAWFATMTGVLIGGVLVFRTKKEAYEPFLVGKKAEQTKAMNIDDDFDIADEPELPNIIDKMNDKLKAQMGG